MNQDKPTQTAIDTLVPAESGGAQGLIRIAPLCRTPQHVNAVAELIYREFWVDVKGGLTEAFLREHLAGTCEDALPLCWVALQGDQVLGCVNLIDNDDTQRSHLHPWLAALVVRAPQRGQGIGSRLVRQLAADTLKLGIDAVYLGTDGPGFYERLGAQRFEQVNAEFFIMRLNLAAALSAP